MAIINDMAAADYHALAALSNSGISDLLTSPRHYYDRHINPERPARESTASQRHGTVAHGMILEPSTFDERFPCGPDVSRATKVWKEWEAKQKAGTMSIKPDEREVALIQASMVRQIPDVARVLGSGNPEVTLLWNENEWAQCKARPDWIHVTGKGAILLDIKTTGNANDFVRQVGRLGYHRQAYWYSRGFEKCSNIKVLGFVFVAVETAWPYAARAFALDEAALGEGQAQCLRALKTYTDCVKKKQWPSYRQDIEILTLPKWAFEEE